MYVEPSTSLMPMYYWEARFLYEAQTKLKPGALFSNPLSLDHYHEGYPLEVATVAQCATELSTGPTRVRKLTSFATRRVKGESLLQLVRWGLFEEL